MRGISPVVATVLMVAIAIAAAVVAYSWLMSVQSQAQAAAGETAGKLGTEALRILEVVCSGNDFNVLVQNMGDVDVTFNSGTINDGTNVYTIGADDFKNNANTASANTISTIELNSTSIGVTCDPANQYEITLYTEAGTPVTWKGKPE